MKCRDDGINLGYVPSDDEISAQLNELIQLYLNRLAKKDERFVTEAETPKYLFN